MAERETSRSIDAAAAAWVAREDRAPLSKDEQQALKAWLDGDIRRPGALLRARAVSLRSESARALGDRYDPAAFGGAPIAAEPSRRRMLAWGGGLAACAAATTLVGVVIQAPEAHATERGEIRLVPLPDGSTVVLNTATRVTVKYDETRRLVRLLEGEADFTVLANGRRPFVVEAGKRRFTTTGGAFRIRKLDGAPVDVLVHQGRLDVAPNRDTGAKAVVVGTNMRLALAEYGAHAALGAPQTVSPDVVTRELAWKDGKLAFEGETLAEAAKTFARYSDTRIVIDDPSLAREPITGLFAANDPAGFGQAVSGMFGAAATRRGNLIVVGRAPARD